MPRRCAETVRRQPEALRTSLRGPSGNATAFHCEKRNGKAFADMRKGLVCCGAVSFFKDTAPLLIIVI